MVLPPKIMWWFCVTCCVACSVNNPWGVCEAFRLLRPAIYSQIWELESQWWRRGCRNTKPSSSRTRRFVFFLLFSFRSFLSFFAHEVSLDDGAKKGPISMSLKTSVGWRWLAFVDDDFYWATLESWIMYLYIMNHECNANLIWKHMIKLAKLFKYSRVQNGNLTLRRVKTQILINIYIYI